MMHRRRQRILRGGRWDRLRHLGLAWARAHEARPLERGAFLRRTWDARRGGVTRWLAICAAAWAIFSLVAGEHGFLRARALSAEKQHQDERAAALRREIGALQHELDASKEDPLRAERLAREELGLAHPGEVVYHLAASANEPETAPLDDARLAGATGGRLDSPSTGR